MNTNTGEIHDLQPFESLPQLADRLGVPTSDLALLGKRPDAGCQRCHGTGVKHIAPSGRRTPCSCTAPFPGLISETPALVPIMIPAGRPASVREDGRQMWVSEKLENGQITITVTLGIPMNLWNEWARAMAGRAVPIKVNAVKLPDATPSRSSEL
jgi:hypothetical protein